MGETVQLYMHGSQTHCSFSDVVHGGFKAASNDKKLPVVIDIDSNCFDWRKNVCSLVCCVKEFDTLTKLKNICANEGFPQLSLRYLGGFWVGIEFDSNKVVKKFQDHIGINSWFSTIVPWSKGFHVEERVVWIALEGIPPVICTKNMVLKIANTWGEYLFMEGENDRNLYGKRICVKTKVLEVIMENVTLKYENKSISILAKEVTGWVPEFSEVEEVPVQEQRDDLEEGEYTGSIHVENWVEEEEDDSEGVAETGFLDEQEKVVQNNFKQEKGVSEDPFDLRKPIEKSSKHGNKNETTTQGEEPKFPPGYTPPHPSVLQEQRSSPIVAARSASAAQQPVGALSGTRGGQHSALAGGARVDLGRDKVYISECFALIAFAIGAYLHILYDIGGALTHIATLGCMYRLLATPPREEVSLLMAFSLFYGAFIGPLIDFAIDVDTSILVTSFIRTAMTFICFSGLAMLAKRKEYLSLGRLRPVAFVILLGLHFASFVFCGSAVLFQVKMFFGLFVFVEYTNG